MKHILLITLLFSNLFLSAQSGSESIEWDDFKSFDIGSQQFKIPYFIENHSFDGDQIFWSKSFESNQKVNEFSIRISNIKTQVINKRDLGQLDISRDV